MAAEGTSPQLQDLYALARLVAADRDASLSTLRQRDHVIGQDCHATDDMGRLLFWVAAREQQAPVSEEVDNHSAVVALALRLAALVLGILMMGGFLLASPNALVNVLLFLALFVVLQLLGSALGLAVLLRSVGGRPPSVSPLNPARLITRRQIPDARLLSENSGTLRLLLLRYGQEFGLLFCAGTMVAFLGLALVTGFGFVWGSTFSISNEIMMTLCHWLAAPWQGWLPVTALNPEIVAGTRYYAASPELSELTADGRSAWWWLLFMSMACYALLPRLLLLVGSRVAYRRALNKAFVALPGAAAILSRMRAPDVSTQAQSQDVVVAPTQDIAPVDIDEGAMLLNWVQALGEAELELQPLLARVPVANRLSLGLGTVDEDLATIARVNAYGPEQLLVLVKAWEPPLADLGDTLARLEGIPQCILCLVPLVGKAVAEHDLEEWQAFAHDVALPFVQCEPLRWP
ncbi:hypothetical protein A3709_09130 [Halioglobus sp. HI00S01]|uniref:DUF2868 domain-containing protein n=1 Tax=Halioglobus sp. HI00S01 TaxID=1822214 RepID=UPI0007C334B8|nr:DUF2868 domain-containing protein [Halioglobus sp. HI00S01]KZX55140.1 hypothetical protein A3709_09130 [Halioglobus sp. HI00S01]